MSHLRRLLGLSFLFASAIAAHVQARGLEAGVELGSGNEVDVFGVTARLRDLRSWELSGWKLEADVQGRIEQWESHDKTPKPAHLLDFSLTPLLHVTRAGAAGVVPYFELGIGAHLLSHTHIAGRDFGSTFQFGEIIGVGIRFGTRQEFDLALRGQHVSNAGLGTPNDGLTFATLAFGWAFP